MSKGKEIKLIDRRKSRGSAKPDVMMPSPTGQLCNGALHNYLIPVE